MKSVYEVMLMTHGENRFEVIVREDGTREYRTWRASTIAEDGIVTALGIKYDDMVTVVTSDDMEVIDVEEMDSDLYEKLIFIEDIEKWEAIHGIKGRDLIGLTSDEFYAKANERCSEK